MAFVAAPSNLGLRPPQPTSVPGCAKAPEALREAGLFQRLAEFGAVDAGWCCQDDTLTMRPRGGCGIRG
jgi:arginase